MKNLMEKGSNNLYHNEEKNKDENSYNGYFSKAFEENDYLKREVIFLHIYFYIPYNCRL